MGLALLFSPILGERHVKWSISPMAWTGWQFSPWYWWRGLGVFAYISGNIEFAQYLHVPFISYNGEVAVVCGSMIGAGG